MLVAAVGGAIGSMEGMRQEQEQLRQTVKQSLARESVVPLRLVPPK